MSARQCAGGDRTEERGRREVDLAVARDEGQVDAEVVVHGPTGDESARGDERALREADHAAESGHDDERQEDDRQRHPGRQDAQ